MTTSTLPHGTLAFVATVEGNARPGPLAWTGDDRTLRGAAVSTLDGAGLATLVTMLAAAACFGNWHILPGIVRDAAPLTLKVWTFLCIGLVLALRCRTRLALRRELWAAVRLDGRPLQYTGTLKDLLVPVLATLGGLLLVFAFFAVLTQFIVPRPSSGPNFKRLLMSVPLVYLMGLGAWRARAHLVSRTMRDGVTGTLTGSAQRYAGVHFLTALLMPLTLGWIVPWRQAMQQRRLIGGMSIGDNRFACDLRASPLLRPFALAWAGALLLYLGTVLLVAKAPVGAKIAAFSRTGTWAGLSSSDRLDLALSAVVAGVALAALGAWYRAHHWRALGAATSLDGRALRLEASTAAIMRLSLGNGALKLAMLGPLAEVRTARFLAQHLAYASFITELDFGSARATVRRAQ